MMRYFVRRGIMKIKCNIMKIKFRSLSILLIIFLIITCPIGQPEADTPKEQEIKIEEEVKIEEVQNIQKDIRALEDVLKILSDEKQKSASISQIESLLAAKRKLLAQKTASSQASDETSGPLNFIQLFQNVKKNLISFLGSLKERVDHLSEDYLRLKGFLSSREALIVLLDIGLKLGLISILVGIVWIFTRRLARKFKAVYQREARGKGKREAGGSLVERVKALGFHFVLTSYSLLILLVFGWGLLNLLFPKKAASATLTLLGAWVGYRVLKNLCCLLITPEDESERLFHLDDSLASSIVYLCRRILLLSMAAFILVRLSSLFGLAKMSAAFLKMYQLGLIAYVAAFLTRWRGGLQKRLSLSLKEDDPLWIRRVKNTYNQAAGRVYLGLIFSFFAIAGLDLAGYERAARFSLYAILESLLAIALAAAIWFFWGRLFQQISTLAEKYVQRYPDLEKEIRQHLAWMGRFARLIIITLALVVIMTIWKVDILGFLSRRASLLFRLVRIPAIILIALFSIQAVMLLIRRAAQRVAETRIQKGEGIPAEIEKQMKTISEMLCKVAAVFICAAAGTMILNELGFSIGPLLAGAGVVGLAVGFGAQNLVRDILSGIFIIVENQVRVGDVAILNGIGGLVEAVNLRTTILRGLDGTVHVFPNGTINTVANMTHGFAYYVFDIGVAYKENIDRVYAILRQIGDQIIQEEPYRSMILEPLEILGVDRFADSAVIIKARIKTQPIKQWVVGREINRRIKERFDQEGIEIPFPHRTFYFGEQSKPIEVNIRNIGDLGGLRDNES